MLKLFIDDTNRLVFDIITNGVKHTPNYNTGLTTINVTAIRLYTVMEEIKEARSIFGNWMGDDVFDITIAKPLLTDEEFEWIRLKTI